MVPVHPGLPISTPHGVGTVVCVRNDGMVVAKLAGSGSNGGYIGYFHPSSVGLAPSPSGLAAADANSSSVNGGAGKEERLVGNGSVTGGGGGRRSGSAPSFLPSAATVPPVGRFQLGAQLGMTAAVESSPAPPHQQPQGFQFRQQPQQQQGFQFQQQQQPQQQQQGFQFQQQQQPAQQQSQQLAGQPFRTPDRSCATPPPSKRRRSTGGEVFVHHH